VEQLIHPSMKASEKAFSTALLVLNVTNRLPMDKKTKRKKIIQGMGTL
jgi:hypothetical protein